MYALNQAPDVAIAEVAIGSAIIPLIYVISIARQREYIVLDRVDHDPSELTEKNEKIYELLNAFVEAHNLKLNDCSNISGDEYTLTDELNVDLILSYDNDKNILIKGKKSSILVSKLKKAARKLSFLEVVALKGGESLIKKISMVSLLVFILIIFMTSIIDLESLYNNSGKLFFL